jgi:ribulose-5-phosphate 4-epimerase/fuculose-1-phosphate aldolase
MRGESILIESLIRTARRAGRAGLVVGTSGNVSVRLSPETFAISASGSRLGELAPEQIAVCAVEDGLHHEGATPSMEAPFHRAIYRVRPDAKAVLHFQSPHATVLACAEEEPRFDLDFIPEASAYLRKIAVVEYHAPGSRDLAEAIGTRACDPECNVLVLRNHGEVVLGSSLESILRNAEVFELACRMVLQGVRLRRFDASTIEALRAYGRD